MTKKTSLIALAAALCFPGAALAQQFDVPPDCTDWVNTCPGVTLTAEMLLLQWSDTDGDDGNDGLSPAYRTTFGFDFGGGRSVRLRYLGFSIDDQIGAGGKFDLTQVDLEYAGRFTLGPNWDGEISLGGRWQSMENPTPRHWKGQYGPVAGVKVRSPITENFAIYGGGRAAYLFGYEEHEAHNHPVGMLEANAGVEWSSRVDQADIYLNAGVEAQYYMSVRDDEEDYGLIGFALGGGVHF